MKKAPVEEGGQGLSTRPIWETSVPLLSICNLPPHPPRGLCRLPLVYEQGQAEIFQSDPAPGIGKTFEEKGVNI